MTKSEKEKHIIRLVSRMIRFHSLLLHNQTYKNELNVSPIDNKYDIIGDYLFEYLRPFFHMKILAGKLVKLKTTKTS